MIQLRTNRQLMIIVAFCGLLFAAPSGSADEPRKADAGELRQVDAGEARRVTTDADLRNWLTNMIVYHRYSAEEAAEVLGLTVEETQQQMSRLGVSPETTPETPADRLMMLPYPGGRHPRIGFLEGAINPQRETKLSVFCPWDPQSYVVMDVPEAIWSNLGLTYLAHTHIDTIWDKAGQKLQRLEWQLRPDGSYVMERRLPNGIVFGTRAVARDNHIEMDMWLKNNTAETLKDLRVQNCVMLKGAMDFDQQTNDNKLFINGYAIARSSDSKRWIISGWSPVQRAWGNAPCPCLHSDPQFPDCAPGETQWLRGWHSFFEGTSIEQELARIEATGWRSRPIQAATGNVQFRVFDQASKQPLAARVYLQNRTTGEWHYVRSAVENGSAIEYRRQIAGTNSQEHHVTVSADLIQATLPAGHYEVTVERGKEYLPEKLEFEVHSEATVLTLDLPLTRFADMAALGWYSGDTHLHRPVAELPNVALAEDVNVLMPMTMWVRDSREIPASQVNDSQPLQPQLIQVDDQHVIWPFNTEYEIFTVDGRRHTLGAVLVLNHTQPLNRPAPPVRPVAELARQQHALLDFDKHSWNWSLMIVPVMGVDLFELTNNHNWRTPFAFPKWTLENAPRNWPEVEVNADGFTEMGWTEFGLQTFYALQNCGFRMRITGGTASGVHPVPAAHGRVYVHTGDSFSYERWIEGLNAGRSVVTNGPLMDVRFNGELPGTIWKTTEPSGRMKIEGHVMSEFPVRSLEVIQNGEVIRQPSVASVRTPEGAYRTEFDLDVVTSGSSWLAVRCFEDRPAAKVAFAHSNPVYVDVAEHPLRPRKRDVEYLLERVESEIIRNEGVLPEESLEEYRIARDVYRRLYSNAR